MTVTQAQEVFPFNECDFDEDMLAELEWQQLKAERGPLIAAADVLALSDLSLSDLKDATFAGVFPAPACRCGPTADKPQVPEAYWTPYWLQQDVIDALPRTRSWLAAYRQTSGA
jgi:hypothetical protein